MVIFRGRLFQIFGAWKRIVRLAKEVLIRGYEHFVQIGCCENEFRSDF